MSSWILNANFWSIITCLKLTSSSQLSPSFIFSWTTIANISAYFKSIVSYCSSHENETWKPYHWIMRGCTYNTCISIILKLKGHLSGSFQNYSLIYFVKVDWNVYKTFKKSATKKGLKILWGEIALQKCLFSTNNSQTLRSSSFYHISSHKNFILEFLHNAFTDLARGSWSHLNFSYRGGY